MSHFAGAFVDGACICICICIGIGIDGGCVGLILIGIGIDGGCVSHFAQAFPYVARVDVEARRQSAHCFQSLQ